MTKEEIRARSIARAEREQEYREARLTLVDLCGSVDPLLPLVESMYKMQEHLDRLQEEVNELKEKKVIVKHHVHENIVKEKKSKEVRGGIEI